ncbi:MAG TPA: ribonuclease P protein component [Bacteroides reticulotermitis]|nr:ribonuclease P protein component [Bacteroides reticulotermitis]
MGNYTLRKAERLNSKLIIGKMFEGGSSKSFSIFPIRVVYMPIEQAAAPVTVLISVSKRRFKRAVKRNWVKRRIREAYRKNKETLLAEMQEYPQSLAIAFIYLSDELVPSNELDEKMKTALARIGEKLSS